MGGIVSKNLWMFRLFYKPNKWKSETLIGHLIYDKFKGEKGLWTFTYDPDFKEQEYHHRILSFPNIERTYASESLKDMEYFYSRIPSSKKLEGSNNPLNHIELLRMYGVTTSNNTTVLEEIK